MAGDQFIELLCSPMKLERDRAANELVKYLPNAEPRAVEELSDALIGLLEDRNRQWECRHGALLGVKSVLPYLKPGEVCGDELIRKLKTNALRLLTDAEVRVRMGAAEVLGKLCECHGVGIYAECKETVLDLIASNLERNVAYESAASRVEMLEKEKLMEKFASSQERGVDAEQIFHDTAGWKSLETSMKALQAMVDGCGSHFEPYINQELLDLVFQTLTHTNRFVRETGFYVCASLVASSVPTDGSSGSHDNDGLVGESNALLTYGHQFSRYLGIGLSDNWSQVRLAAAAATRKFLLSLPEEIRQNFYPELLPKLCMNRYYLAEGVRLFSQETWRQVAGTEGRELVQKHIDSVVKYYIEQSTANNHAVREAACSCIAELATKLNPEVVKPYVGELLKTLLACFQDDSWPVRDAACLACGNFVMCFPEESRGSLDKLYPLFFANLEDNITSVRQGAAASLVNVVKAYGQEVLLRLVERATSGLKGVENQPEESKKYTNIETGPAPFGVVKRLRDNDMELHTNQTMYSCGSLAPKMSRGGAGCSGCLDRSFRRPPQPWEVADGCVYLVSELASLANVHPYMPAFLDLLAKAATFRHYTHHLVLLETICKQLPIIAKGFGKKNFKPHLEAFFEPIFYGLGSENALTSSAASQCLNQLGVFLGPNILRSRLEQFNPSFMEKLDANLHIAPY